MSVEKLIMNPRVEFFDKAALNWSEKITTEEENFLRFIIKKAETKPELGNSVLDVGCGTGVLFPFLSGFEVYALDISNEMLRRAREKNFQNVVEYIQADACNLPFSNNKFAKVILLAVFPHFDNPLQTMKEVYRVLKPGGVAILIHLKNREIVNHIHTSIGGAIANDIVPKDNELISIWKQSGFDIEYSEFNERIAVIGRKN